MTAGRDVSGGDADTAARASRLASLLLLLQTRGKPTARQLGDESEMSVRTIYRDVESLHTVGIPLYGDAGSAGGCQPLGGYRTRLTGLSADEAQALSLAALPGPAVGLGLSSSRYPPGTWRASTLRRRSTCSPGWTRNRPTLRPGGRNRPTARLSGGRSSPR
ncbi:HTH domain-containing protein [Streptomyces sp. NBS 14/10]|uniref:helix-turn-helix transcriptional regulator n=1 Tax=Streptomyces sp. NBS 14/10 TaxID=1945643 RepID=UPI000B7F32B5